MTVAPVRQRHHHEFGAVEDALDFQREKLLALGTITAGLTHQLNNPAAAITRDIATHSAASSPISR